ncbi:transposase, partial [Streptococcus sp. S784/96/1]
NSSGEKDRKGGITKAGNSHVRRLLIEATQSIAKGRVGHKSKNLKKRQNGNSPEVIAYTDRANERLRRRYYKLVLSNNKK